MSTKVGRDVQYIHFDQFNVFGTFEIFDLWGPLLTKGVILYIPAGSYSNTRARGRRRRADRGGPTGRSRGARWGGSGGGAVAGF